MADRPATSDGDLDGDGGLETLGTGPRLEPSSRARDPLRVAKARGSSAQSKYNFHTSLVDLQMKKGTLLNYYWDGEVEL